MHGGKFAMDRQRAMMQHKVQEGKNLYEEKAKQVSSLFFLKKA
jgi:hypothetical protein